MLLIIYDARNHKLDGLGPHTEKTLATGLRLLLVCVCLISNKLYFRVDDADTGGYQQPMTVLLLVMFIMAQAQSVDLLFIVRTTSYICDA